MGFLSRLFGFDSSADRSRCFIPMKPDPNRGYTNLGEYEVRGINLKTNRSNKKRCVALSDEDAIAWARTNGLSDPITVNETPRCRASKYQIEALMRNGYRKDIDLLTNVDASAIMSYIEDGDQRRINQKEWQAACDAGFVISALSGPTLYKIIMETGDWHRYDE